MCQPDNCRSNLLLLALSLPAVYIVIFHACCSSCRIVSLHNTANLLQHSRLPTRCTRNRVVASFSPPANRKRRLETLAPAVLRCDCTCRVSLIDHWCAIDAITAVLVTIEGEIVEMCGSVCAVFGQVVMGELCVEKYFGTGDREACAI